MTDTGCMERRREHEEEGIWGSGMAMKSRGFARTDPQVLTFFQSKRRGLLI